MAKEPKDIKIGSGVLRIQKSEFKGYHFIDVRKYYEAEDGEFKPTKKGITLSLDIVDEVIEAIKKANQTG